LEISDGLLRVGGRAGRGPLKQTLAAPETGHSLTSIAVSGTIEKNIFARGFRMDYGLNAEQRAWQMKARKFAEEEIMPLSLARECIPDPVKTFDWEIIKKGSRLGFRTAVVPKEWGGHGIDHVTQALVMSELARADSAISKTFSQCWKFSHRIANSCTPDQRERFLVLRIINFETFLVSVVMLQN
jgi:alkylation response protein AidB-like acyl-CoA dehydrogenase